MPAPSLFLEDLIGYKDVISEAGVTMPRRAALSFEGSDCTVTDDPINEQTVVTLGGALTGGGEGGGDAELDTVLFELSSADALVEVEGIGEAEVVQINPTDADFSIADISITGLTMTRKILVNVGDDSFSLSDSSTADTRIFVASDTVVPADGAIEVLYIPASGGVDAGWRVL